MIGIVGGMGPYAGLDLARKIMDNTVAVVDQDHLPLSILSLPNEIPDRSNFVNGEDGATNPGPAIAAAVDRLADQGCTIIGMACNTAHAETIFKSTAEHRTSNGSASQLLHMIDEVAGYLRSHYPEVTRVGILATTATVRSKLYDRFLEKRNFTPVYLEASDQHKLSEVAIRDPEMGIKAHSNPVTEQASSIVRRSVSRLADKGAQVVLLACTELPLAVTETVVADIPVVDPTNVFARVIIERYAPDKLAP